MPTAAATMQARPPGRGTLLATKLAPPILLPGRVQRGSLSDVLDAARGLALVSAPPGYGKTTAVADWLARSRVRAGWLTLDDGDDDPAVFLAYLAAAAGLALGGPEVEIGETLRPSPVALAPVLNLLGASGTTVALVLDDYQLVTSPAVHELTSFLVGHLPPNVRTVVITRHDPPLPLARLRSRGLLAEIRAADLRFSAADCGRFLGATMGLDVPASGIERLMDRTEGWVAGLQLAALSLRATPDPGAFIDAFGSSDRYIFDYLTDEALAIQPVHVRAFLEATCILDRLTAPLCDAVTGRTDGARTLADLARANVFLAPLDERREWYRYHRLFADLVASGVPAERRVALHGAAAAWFAAHGLLGEAIRHYLAAGDPASAAPLMEKAAQAAVARGEFRTVTAWCGALPERTLADHPNLGVVDAWARFFSGDLAASSAALGRLTAAGLQDPTAEARRACLEAWFANRRDRGDAEALARRAVAGIPDADPVFRSLAFTTLGESLVARDTAGARAAFAEAHRLARASGRSTLLAGTVYSLASVHLIVGERTAAEDLCRAAIADAGSEASTPAWVGMIHLPLGIARFEADALDQARQHLSTGRDLVDRAGLRVTMLGAAEWYEILAQHLAGDPDHAWRRLEAVRRDAERAGIARVATGMALLAAELLLLEGDPRGALARLEALPASHGDVLGTTRDRGRITWARVFLATGDPTRALALADALAVEQRADGRQGRLIGTLVTLAHAQARTGDRAGSVASLEEAVAAAAQERYRRVFRDSVFPTEGLLAGVRHVAPEFVDSLLEPAGSARGSTEAASAGGHPSPDLRAINPREPLSVRELEVLRLVAAGLSNEEIGRALFVSTGTAKWHVHNVLGKTGARNRVGLIAAARAAGLV